MSRRRSSSNSLSTISSPRTESSTTRNRRERTVSSPNVDRSPTSDRREPRTGILRDALLAPGREGSGEGVLYAFLRDVEVAGDAYGGRHHERPLVTVGVRDGEGHGRTVIVVADLQLMSRIGRTSTPPKLAGTSRSEEHTSELQSLRHL